MEHSQAAPAPENTNHDHAQHTSHENVYESNPFKAAITGIITLFKVNPFPSILIGLVLGLCAFLAILVAVGICFIYPPVGTIIGVLLILAIIVVFIPLLNGAYHAMAVSSLHGEKAGLGTFIKAAYKKLFPLLGASILIGLATLGGFLLFIIPGIIFSTWFSLTFFVIFDENLGPVAAMKRSKELVSGHFFEMIGAITAGALFNSLTSGASGGILGPVVTMAPMMTRYDQLKALKASSQPKPKVHWLNYLALGLYILFIGLVMGYYALLIATGAYDDQGRYRNDHMSPPSQRQQFHTDFNSDSTIHINSSPNTLTN